MTPQASVEVGGGYTALRFLGSGSGEDSDTFAFRSHLGYTFTRRLTGFVGYNYTYLPTLTFLATGGPAVTIIGNDTFPNPAGNARLAQEFRWGSAGIRYSHGTTTAGGFGGTSNTEA